MSNPAAFWDKIAPGYARRKIGNPDAYQATLARTRSYLTPTDRVLEIGAGTSSTALELAASVAHITATDISTAMVEIGREKAQAAAVDNITITQGGVGDASLSDGAPFDVILAHNIVHLVPDVPAALSQVHSLLKPGGLLISKTPCIGEKPLIRPLVAVMRAFGKAPDVVHLTIAGLERHLAAEGFETVERLVQTGFVPTLYVVARST